MRQNSNQKIMRMAELAMLIALVVVLQIFGGFIKFGPFSLTLVLIPIVIGSVVLGAGEGTALGAVFGVTVTVQCALGIDAGGFILWGINPFFTALICIVKGMAAGFVPGVIYRALNKSGDKKGRHTVGAVLAAASAPVVNTGIFLAGLSLFFNSTLVEWAGGANVLLYIVTVLVGINFVIEFCVNTVVSPAISTVIRVLNKRVK